jgi:hypothetical protein
MDLSNHELYVIVIQHIFNPISNHSYLVNQVIDNVIINSISYYDISDMMPPLEPEIIRAISNHNQDIEFLIVERLIKYSLFEYTTLFQYIYHINNQINKLDIVHCSYIFDNDEYVTNKWFVNNIRKFIKLRNENNDDITRTQEILNNFQLSPSNYPSSSFIENYVSIPDIYQIYSEFSQSSNHLLSQDTTINKYINNIKKTTFILSELKSSLSFFRSNKKKLNELQKKERKYKLMHDLYLNSLNFNCEKCNYLPEDIVRILQEYIGEDTLHMVRKTCISKKYFSNPKVQFRSLFTSWNIKHLKLYCKHVFLKYQIHLNNDRKFQRNRLFSSFNKNEIIDYILQGIYKFSFYNFLRDIHIITGILRQNKRRIRERIRSAVITTGATVITST